MTVPKFSLALAEEIYWAHRKNEMIGAIIYGEWGIGKSSYCIQLLREIYPGEEWKRFLVFKPEDFLKLVNSLLEKWERVPLIAWDDAGLWLYALDWNDPRVKSVVKFLNVARTVMGGLVMTTPAIDMIVGKIPHIEGMRIGKITKTGKIKGEEHTRRLSLARNTFTKWGKRYTQDYLEDRYDVMLPTDVFNYYSPLRDTYAREAYRLMRKAWFSDLLPGPENAVVAPSISSKDYEGKTTPD